MISRELLVAVLRRPGLWGEGVRTLLAMAPRRWWRRAPYLPKPDVAYWAATLIGRLGPDGAASVPALIAALEDSPHQNVRQRAARALGKIGPGAAAAKDSLQKAAAGDDPRMARLAERALGAIER